MMLDFLRQYLTQGARNHARRAAAWIPPAIRQGSSYSHWRRFLLDSERWPNERVAEWQTRQLQAIVKHAFECTEGYRHLYSKAGVRPEDIRSISDMRFLPLTSKELFQDNLEAFTVANNGASRYVTTGGSTGIPFGFYQLASTNDIECAFMHAGWRRAGWRLGTRSGVLRGAFVGSRERLWSYDRYNRELSLSSYYLTAETVADYANVIRRFKLRVLQAYPSSLNLLCDLLLDAGLNPLTDLELLLLGSENLYDWQTEKIARVFPRARVFSWYGHTEKAVLAPWCETSRRYHPWPFYGLTEILNSQSCPVMAGEEGEIVGTSFHQKLTPFIRYRTMDLAVTAEAPCECGRAGLTLSKIGGRSHEVILTSTGRYISMTAINMHDDIFDPIRQFQFRQERAGHLVFRYVPKLRALTPAQDARIRTGLQAKLGVDVELQIEAVSHIPRTKTGKFRFLDQQLPIKYRGES